MSKVRVVTNKSLSKDDQDRLYDLMIYAYEQTETEIWGDNYKRMSREEYQAIMDSPYFHIAYIEDKIVGSVYYYPIHGSTFGFGLLNADFSESGKGIGKALIASIEEAAKLEGADTMQLEILRPESIDVPFKNQLAKWYKKQGYQFVGTYSFLDLKPDKSEKVKNMVNPSVFDVYKKALT